MQTHVAAGGAAAARRRQAAAGARRAGARGGLSCSCAASRTGCRCSPTQQTHTHARGRADPRTHRASPWASPTGRPAPPSSTLHRARVTRAFQEVMFARNEAAPAEMPGVNGIVEAWLRGADGAAARRRARGARLRRGRAGGRSCCIEFRGAARMRRLDAPGRARLDTLLPRLLAAIADVTDWRESSQVDVLRRVLKVLEAIGSRSAYFALLNENRAGAPQARGARRAAANSSPRRSPRIRCCSTSCWTSPPAGCRRRAPSSKPKSTARLAHSPRTSPSARWKCCASSSAPRSSAWPWPTSPERFR